MKRIFIFIAVIALLAIFPITAFATEQTDILEEFGVSDLKDNLSDDVITIYEELEVEPYTTFDATKIKVTELLVRVINNTFADYTEPFYVLGLVTVITMICIIFSSVIPLNNKWHNESFDIIVSVITSVIIILPLSDIVVETKNALDSMSVLINAFLPVFTALTAASGYSAVAGTYSVVMMGFSSVFSVVNTKLLMPISNILIAVSVCTTYTKPLTQLTAGVKKTIIWFITICSTVFAGILSLQTKLSSVSDGITMRTAKTMLSTMIPIVGQTLGDSVNLLIGNLNLAKTTVGMFTIVSVIIMVLPVTIKLLLWKLVTVLSKSMLSISENKSAPEVLDAVGSVITVIISVILFSTMMVILSVFTVLSVGGIS